MESTQLLIIILLSLVGLLAAWYGGARWAGRGSLTDEAALSKSYFRGLNFLINEEPDESIDAFINSLEVNADTLETHLALGTLMRRRGEVERAIRIHQNLLSHPRLDRDQLYQVQLELARDFMQAGLLDRAERLMLDLAEMSERYRQSALKYLMGIYRDEHEWEKAIGVAGKLWSRRFGFQADPMAVEQGHFCCELAEQALAKAEYLEARRQLRSALKYDKNSVRASLLLGRLDVQQHSYGNALKHFEKIVSQDPDFLPEAVDYICKAYQALGQERELIDYLSRLYEKYPGNTLLLALTDRVRCVDGEQQAIKFIEQRLGSAPSLKVLLKLLDWEKGSRKERRHGSGLLKAALQKLLDSQAQYRCQNCGFAGQQLHWLCPTCKSWGTVKPIGGIDGGE